MSADCPFCRMVSGDAPSSVIFQDDAMMVFMNIRAINKGECMVIPREHIDLFTDIPDDLAARMIVVAQKVGRRILEVYRPERIGYVVHGYGVPHAHLIVVPQNDPNDITSGKFARAAGSGIVFSDRHIPEIPRVDLDRMARELSIT